MYNRFLTALALTAACAFGIGDGAAAHAQTAAVASGNWSTPSTWSAGEPNDLTFATINGGLTVTVDQSLEITNLLDVGTIAGETGNLNITAGDLTLTDTDTVTEPNIPSIRLGQVVDSTGNLTMSGGTVFIDGPVGSGFAIGDLMLGDNGTGSMTMTGGSFTAADEVFVGFARTSHGSLSVSGGTFDVQGRNLLVGFLGADTGLGLPGAVSTFNLSGTGTVNVAGFMFSSFELGATSTLTQTGGTFNIGSAFVLGRMGNSTFNHSAGAVNVTGGNGDFVAGDNGPLSTYNISGTATVDTVNQFMVGVFADAHGLVNQSGGTINSGGNVRIGVDGVGDYNLSAGVLTAETNLFLGDFDSSQGTMKITGGVLNVTGNLNVGAAIASNALDDRVAPDGTNGPQGQALDANGTLIIEGVGGDINVTGNLLANPDDKSPARNGPGQENDSILKFTLGSTGISTISVGMKADLDGAIIDIDDAGGFFAANPASTLTLIDAAGGFGNVYTLTAAEAAGNGLGYTLAAGDASLYSLQVMASGAGQKLVLSKNAGGLPGDFDGDNDVDGNDFLVFQRGFGSTFDASDLADFKNNFGTHAAGAVAGAVPEPAAAVLMLVAAGLLAGGRRAKAAGRLAD